MKNEFALAFNEVLEERQLPKEIIMEALESALITAYQKSVNASKEQHIEAKIDPETGKVMIFAEKEVVEDVQNPTTEVSLDDARRVDPEAELGGMAIVESTPDNFGRVAAQTARQVIQQRIREAEHKAQMDFYNQQLGEIVSGIVQAVNAQGLTIGLEMRAEGTMPRKELIPRERFRTHDRVRALIAEVKDTPRGPQIILSRTHKDFLRRLLENEVPEIFHGIVEIRSISREPGERAKVAVSANQSGIDPVGACVGIRGVRIQAIVRELHDEKIDVIEWSPDAAVFIAKAISPARVVGVYLDETSENGRTATVVVPEDQLSLAIGRDGQNARLAAKLTSWRIDIKSLSEALGDTLHKLEQDAKYAKIAESEKDNIQNMETLLARRAEGRPLTPEEFDAISKFVDRVERQVTGRVQHKEKEIVDQASQELRSTIPVALFEQNLLDSSLPEHVSNILQEAGYTTTGDLVLQMKKHPDEILKLQGMGPKSMEKIMELVASIEAQAAPVEQKVDELKPAEEVVTEPSAVETVVAKPVEDEVIQIEEPVHAESTMEDTIPTSEISTASGEQPEKVEEDVAFEDLFKLKPDMVETFAPPEEVEEEEEGDLAKSKKGKKGKKGHSVEVVYDDERDMILRKKKHKRGGDVWDWEAD